MMRTRRTFDLAEGPRWFHERWYFVDILAGRLFSLAADDGQLQVSLEFSSDEPLGAVAAIGGEEPGTWLAGLGDGVAVLRHGEVHWLDRPESGAGPRRRMNDGVCDPAGRFWVGSMAFDATDGAGSLFRVDADGTVERVLDGITIPNGPAFTADGATMYLADSARRRVDRYEVDPVTGRLGDAQVFVDVEDASPDGMVVDTEGDLWIAMWGGGRVDRFDPHGRLVHSISVPSRQPTAPCFGGLGNDELLITSAAHGLTDPSRHDGAVWSLPGLGPGPASRPAVLSAR